MKLTAEELSALIAEATATVLSEIDGKTYARVHNATQTAQQELLSSNATSQNGTSSISVIKQGIALDTDAADSLIAPFKTKYPFHCQDLLGTAAITIFDLKQLYELTHQKRFSKAVLHSTTRFCTADNSRFENRRGVL